MTVCTDPDVCGRPQQGAGRPKKGWIKTHVAGQRGADAWWCSASCLVTELTQAGAVARADVSKCPLCINRHDRDHRCGVCNSQPHLVRAAPAPVQLYANARKAPRQERRLA